MKPLTRVQSDTLRRLPVGEWVDVPHYICGSTIRGLVKRGLIEHRPSDPSRYDEWITEGQIRRLPEVAQTSTKV